MPEYSKEDVIAWLELIRDSADVDIEDEEGLARAAIAYLKASMPALEGDTA